MPCNKARGFTLIEVLVALAIIGVALAASVRAVGVIAQNNAALRNKSLALVEAENRLAELRMTRLMPPTGRQTTPCRQGRQQMQCEQIITTSENNNIRQATIRVHPPGVPTETLAQVNGFVTSLP